MYTLQLMVHEVLEKNIVIFVKEETMAHVRSVP